MTAIQDLIARLEKSPHWGEQFLSGYSYYGRSVDATLYRELIQLLSRWADGTLTEEEIHNTCHNLPKTVSCGEFAEGCIAHMAKLYGPEGTYNASVLVRFMGESVERARLYDALTQGESIQGYIDHEGAVHPIEGDFPWPSGTPVTCVATNRLPRHLDAPKPKGPRSVYEETYHKRALSISDPQQIQLPHVSTGWTVDEAYVQKHGRYDDGREYQVIHIILKETRA